MTKFVLKLWKSDKPEPDLYAYNPDPNNTIHMVDEDIDEFVRQGSKLLESCSLNLEEQLPQIEKRLNNLKQEWIKLGGSEKVFNEVIIPRSYTSSKWAKNIPKSYNKTEYKPNTFNGLDFSKIK